MLVLSSNLRIGLLHHMVELYSANEIHLAP